MRLGLKDDLRAEECALAIEAAGASELVVHARTKAHGYRPPAYWERVGDIRQRVKLPLVANGEIWTATDAQACQRSSGCNALMLGRGMVANPGLALEILTAEAANGLAQCAAGAALVLPSTPQTQLVWTDLLPLIVDFWQQVRQHMERRQQTGRLKQWLNLLQRSYPQAQQAFIAVRGFHDPADVDRWLAVQAAGLEN